MLWVRPANKLHLIRHPCRYFRDSINPGLAIRWLGVRREIHSLDEFLFPAHPTFLAWEANVLPLNYTR